MTSSLSSILIAVLKSILWLAMAVAISIASLIIASETFGWSEHPLGNRLYIYAMLKNTEAYDVFLTSGTTRLEQIVPTSYANAYDTIDGRRRESVERIIRYPDYLAITVVNSLDGSKKYFIVDKNYHPDDITDDQIIEKHLFETSDSVLFKTMCAGLRQHK